MSEKNLDGGLTDGLDADEEDTPSQEGQGALAALDKEDLPYTFWRSDANDGRQTYHQIHARESTDRMYNHVEEEITDRFNDDILKKDLREAIFRVGLNHAGEIEEELREDMGYDLSVEELITRITNG